MKLKSARRSVAAALTPFHLAFAVDDLRQARIFYGKTLGCREGRSTNQWIDFDLFGHQIVTHLKKRSRRRLAPRVSLVDGVHVPVPHFGVVLTMSQFRALARRLRVAGVQFLVEPCVRFKGKPGEQATMFFLDPTGNALEFKAFADLKQLFAT